MTSRTDGEYRGEKPNEKILYNVSRSKLRSLRLTYSKLPPHLCLFTEIRVFHLATYYSDEL
jgi:hypothetical protein